MNIEEIRELYKENGLSTEDIHQETRGGKKITIITRSGIEKIQAVKKINVKFNLEHVSDGGKTVIIKAVAKMGELECETYGEASSGNTKNAYPIAMAEKRALSRVVLKISGFYKHGYFGEDEFVDQVQTNIPKISKLLSKIETLDPEKKEFYKEMLEEKKKCGELTDQIVQSIFDSI